MSLLGGLECTQVVPGRAEKIGVKGKVEIWAWLTHCPVARRPHPERKAGPRESLAQLGRPVVKLPPSGAWEGVLVEVVLFQAQ